MARAATSFLRISTQVRNDLRAFCRKQGFVMGTAASEALRQFIATGGGNRLSKPIKQKRTKKAEKTKLTRTTKRVKKVSSRAATSAT